MPDDDTAIRRPAAIVEPGERRLRLIMLSGPKIGKVCRLDKPKIIIGRADDADLQVEDEGISRHHVRLVAMANGLVMLNDLESRNGTFVNGEQVRARVLEDGDRIQLGAITILKFSIQDSLEEQFQEQLYASATRDALTGAHNHRYFAEHLKTEVSHAERHSTPLSLLIIDIDHFKAINDRYGHPAGDQVLRELSARVTSAIRSDDVFGRLGGEEFGLILRGNALQGALVLAERIRRRIEKEPFACAGGSIAITVSIGVASHDKGKHGEALVAEADRHLYGAKSSGRNCVQGPS